MVNINREEYIKSNILSRITYRVTQDFIVAASNTTPLRRYLPEGKSQISTLTVWAKRNGKYKGNGFSYRINTLGHTDTTFALIVNDHVENIVSYIHNE